MNVFGHPPDGLMGVDVEGDVLQHNSFERTSNLELDLHP